MRLERLFGIVNYLLVHGGATAGKLAERFEVSERTILRDIAALAGGGAPVYASRGQGGGISLLDGHALPRAALSDAERDLILLALQSLAASGQTDAANTLLKIGALFRASPPAWIEVDFSRWGVGKPARARFETLAAAIAQKRAVSFSYVNAAGEFLERSAFPVKLIFKGMAWYFQGFCLARQDYRTFRLSRLRSPTVLALSSAGLNLAPPPPLELEGDGAPLLRLKMEFNESAAYRLFDVFDENAAIRRADGAAVLETDAPDEPWLYGFLLSLGTSVKILEPASVRLKLREILAELRERYASP
ncbi:MAG: YafY family transcriptional regulator [Deltaproteobacteria bacterium]|jgi:predicted DNA-binding transcriptional regulator YafY|nr:YafY family transcriptional regulator [Deltaproteobacteria bacterium]